MTPELNINDHNFETNTHADEITSHGEQIEESAHNATAEDGHGELVHEATLFAEPVFHVGNFPITNALMTSWIAVLILVIIGLTLRAKLKQIPGKLQNAFEVIYEGALSLADQVTNNRKLSNKVLPITLTLFLFILINNWLGIIPGVGSIGQIAEHHGEQVFIPYLRGGTADLNTTLAMAVMAVVGANIFGMLSIGIWKTFNKFINIKILGQMFTKVRKDPTILVVAPITFFVGIIEIIGEFAKIASLSFRLFGNVFAGEVLLASMAAIFAYAVPIPFLFLEVLVGLIQALIFAMLTLVYFTIASHDHEHDEHEGGAHEPHAELVEEGVVAEGKMTT